MYLKTVPLKRLELKPEDWIISINGIRMDTANDTSKTAILLNAPVKTEFVLGEYDEEGDLWADRTVSITKEDKSLFSKAISKRDQTREIKHVNPIQLFVNIMGLCIFPFVAKPIIQLMAGKDKAQFDALIEERKTEIPKMIIASIKK